MSKKRIVMLLMVGVVIATMMVLALNVTANAQGYGAVGGASTGGSSSSGSGTPGTGAEVILFGVAGAGLIAAGFFLTRKAKA
ncbi:MAG: hypothetical protein Q7K29_00230 [Thermoleophilia bacterium]|nr:hypothetical protein [Thermoleophilia bacterium]